MFKKEINFITNLNVNKLQILGDKFTLDDIKKSRIHPAIFQFINAKIDHQILNDRLKITENSVFDYKGERIKNYFALISDEIKRTQLFDFDYVNKLLSEAILFYTNFLINPKPSLTKLIFRDSETKFQEEIIVGLSHSYYYKYIQKIILTYLEKKQIISMNRDEFNSLLERIDTISKETHLEDTLITAVNSITNFFAHQSKSSSQVPLLAVIEYLKNRDLSEYINSMQDKFGTDETLHVSSTELINVIKSVTPVTELEINDSVKIENELEEEIEQSPQGEIVETLENIEKNQIEETPIVPLSDEHIFNDHENDEIPNHEILSNEIETENGKSIDSSGVDEGLAIKEDTPNFNEENDLPDENIDEDVKKKPDTKLIAKKLLDLNSVFDSVLTPIKPFDIDSNINLESIVKNNISEQLGYQIDLSTIAEEIEIKRNESTPEEKFEYSEIDLLETQEDNSTIEEINIGDESKIETPTDDVILDSELSINETIDDVINDENIEDEFLQEVSTNYEEEVKENENIVKILDDDMLTITEEGEEEITEVFTDLEYLNKSDDEKNTTFLQNDEQTELVDNDYNNKEEQIEDTSKTNENSDTESFIKMLKTKEMTKIIEYVFDYDMEDYHSITNQITNSHNETKAIEILHNYCNDSNVETHSSEVETLENYISEYFSKIYS